MTVDPIKTPDERETRECENCGGDVIEPRSSNTWNCATCARQYRLVDGELVA